MSRASQQPPRSAQAGKASQSLLERVAWPIAGALLAVVLYFALPAVGPAAVRQLQEAVIEGNVAAVRHELDRGISPDQPNASGWTASHYAAFFGRREVLDALLAAGAAVDVRSSVNAHTPLHRAAIGGHVGIIEFLLERGADIDALTKRSETPLILALEEGKSGAALTLFDHGADVTRGEGNAGRKPIHLAVLTGKRSFVEAMLDRGALVDARTRTGLTPLHEASTGLPSVMTPLLERGADPRARDSRGNTPLHEAARYNCRTCVERLIAAGALAAVRNRAGQHPADVADELGHTALAEILRRQAATEPSDSPPASNPEAPPAPAAG